MKNWRGMAWAFLALALACGDGGNSATLEGATGCERFTSLAEAKGCLPPTGCDIPAACEDEAMGWIDCAATDLDQCICESDGELNCEGSWKPDEGPARCIAQQSTFAACEPP